MRLLIDECVDVELKVVLSTHGFECRTVREMGYSGKRNGELLTIAEDNFDVLVTIDKSIRYQHNFTGRKIAVLVIRPKTSKLTDILPHIPAVVAALSAVTPGQVVYVESRQ